MQEKKTDILELLVRHELIIRRLYEVFAAQFEDHHDFWNKIAGDEQKHANQLESLRKFESAISEWLLIENKLKAEAIQLSIAYIDDLKKEAESGRFDHVRALSIAKDIEAALLEKVFYRIGDNIPQKIKSVLFNIAADTEQHHNSITKLLDTVKSY